MRGPAGETKTAGGGPGPPGPGKAGAGAAAKGGVGGSGAPPPPGIRRPALWGRPQATFASALSVAGSVATVTRETDAGLETLEVDLPAVITTDLRLNQPRYVKLPEILKAKTKPLAVTALASLGVEEVFWGVAVKPGKPTLLAECSGVPLVGLPGNPLSALVVFGLVGVPLVWRLAGVERPPPGPTVRARLGRDLASATGRLGGLTQTACTASEKLRIGRVSRRANSTASTESSSNVPPITKAARAIQPISAQLRPWRITSHWYTAGSIP